MKKFLLKFLVWEFRFDVVGIEILVGFFDKIYVIGDIYGCFDFLLEVEGKIEVDIV